MGGRGCGRWVIKVGGELARHSVKEKRQPMYTLCVCVCVYSTYWEPPRYQGGDVVGSVTRIRYKNDVNMVKKPTRRSITKDGIAHGKRRGDHEDARCLC